MVLSRLPEISIGLTLRLDSDGLDERRLEDEEEPLPAEGVEGNAEGEPPDKLEVGEEVEGPGGRTRLKGTSHIDPALHPHTPWPCERIYQKHNQNPRVNPCSRVRS